MIISSESGLGRVFGNIRMGQAEHMAISTSWPFRAVGLKGLSHQN
jgi:hypothetical protein